MGSIAAILWAASERGQPDLGAARLVWCSSLYVWMSHSIPLVDLKHTNPLPASPFARGRGYVCTLPWAEEGLYMHPPLIRGGLGWGPRGHLMTAASEKGDNMIRELRY